MTGEHDIEQCLPFPDINLEVLGLWKSPRTGAAYPSGWSLVISEWCIDLIITQGPLPNWEGSCNVTGSHQDRAFIELVGYARGWGQPWLRLVAKSRKK